MIPWEPISSAGACRRVPSFDLKSGRASDFREPRSPWPSKPLSKLSIRPLNSHSGICRCKNVKAPIAPGSPEDFHRRRTPVLNSKGSSTSQASLPNYHDDKIERCYRVNRRPSLDDKPSYSLKIIEGPIHYVGRT